MVFGQSLKLNLFLLQVFDCVWGKTGLRSKRFISNSSKDKRDNLSVCDQVYEGLAEYTRYCQRSDQSVMLIEMLSDDLDGMKEKDLRKCLLMIRICFLKLAEILKNIDTKGNNPYIFHYKAFSDMLYFYAFTHTMFSSYEYPPFSGDPVKIRECDVSNVEKYLNEGKL